MDVIIPTAGGVVERLSFLLKTGFQSDCSFLVGDGMNAEEFHAHRLILGSSSPVFRAMLYGPLAEKGLIKVIDMCPEVFKVLLEFIYTDVTSLSSLEHACGVLYAASKYMLPELTKNCASYIAANVGAQNVCSVLELARSLGVSELGPPCFKVMCKNGEEILSSSDMLRLSGSTLSALLQYDDLQVENETVVFEAAIRWAQNRVKSVCNFASEEDIQANCSEVRAILRSTGVLPQIRFLTMNTEQFTRGPASSGVLSPVEIWAIMARIDPNPQESPIPSLPVGLSAQTRARVRLPTPVRRPEGTVVRRRTVKSSQLMRHVTSPSDFMMDLSVSDNVVLTGISFCTQIPGVEEYARGRPAPPDVYTEELRVQILSRRGDNVEVVGQTNFKGILPYNGVATIALSKPVPLTRSKGYSIAVTLARAGDYPLSILSPREFHSGIAFRFEDFAQFGDRQNLSQDLGFILGVVFSET